MARILGIRNGIIEIGTDDGGITEVRDSDINFVPHVGDEVEIYQTETKTIVSKKEEKNTNAMQSGGININMQQNAQPMYVANGKKAVNKVAYCLLTLFLGGIGAHKFYAGKVGTGILYLVFCWTCVPEVIALIELVIALCAKADSNGMILV